MVIADSQRAVASSNESTGGNRRVKWMVSPIGHAACGALVAMSGDVLIDLGVMAGVGLWTTASNLALRYWLTASAMMVVMCSPFFLDSQWSSCIRSLSIFEQGQG